jgi:ATP-dependent DNA helicase RecQ
MKDQVDGLARKGVPATMINSTLTPNEQQERIRQMQAGEFRLVYVAPERFRSQSFVSALQGIDIALFAIDEAHCLSQWGHDFRPDYLRLNQAIDALGRPQTAAFTATATPEVRKDILKHLDLRDPYDAVSGFERSNLSLAVTQVGGGREKYDRLEAIIKEHKTGIVYCATRKKVEEVSDSLAAMGIKVVAYHGGMDDRGREHAQNVFLDRTKDVAVATNAFGMGIDRSDVRFVIHFETPGSIEAYYHREIGRMSCRWNPAPCTGRKIRPAKRL